MAEINVIFRGSMSITSKTQGKKIQREISLAQQIEPGRRMRWSDDYISFGLEDHIDMELSERNLPLVVKILIGRHKVANTLIDSGTFLVMSPTIIREDRSTSRTSQKKIQKDPPKNSERPRKKERRTNLNSIIHQY
jgi:hypothetical protein